MNDRKLALVVHPDPPFAETLQQGLERDGVFSAEVVHSPEVAVQRMNTGQRIAFVLVYHHISDGVFVPTDRDFDGSEVVEAACTTEPPIPVVVLKDDLLEDSIREEVPRLATPFDNYLGSEIPDWHDNAKTEDSLYLALCDAGVEGFTRPRND